jgi:hypothetical protein
MRLFRLHPIWFALILAIVVESIYASVYYFLGSTYGYGTFTNIWCDSYLWTHRPAFELTRQFFAHPDHPDMTEYLLYFFFSLCELWLILLAGVWSVRHFRRKSA